MTAMHRVIIVGGGFGGIQCARALRRAPCEVVLVDRRNHHTFQPLLYQVATAALAPSEVGYPIRRVFRSQRRVTVVLGEVIAIDAAARTIRVREGSAGDGAPREVRYDTLVLAAGASTHYFGHDEWSDRAPSLKTLEDAVAIRGRILEAFERAEVADDEALRRWLLTFVVVGGGPTGVELAGAIKELAVDAIARDFRRVDTTTARVILVEGGDRVLPAMDAPLSESARRTLERLGVEVRLGALVTDVDERGIAIGAERLDAANVVWAAGVKASNLGTMLGAATDGSGRVRTEPDLSVPGHPEVFVIGDMARVEDPDGSLVPGVAPAAMQMGRFVGRVVRDRLMTRDGARSVPHRFRYRDKGSLATIGRSAAVAKVAGIRFRGFIAWFLWGAVHLTFLVGFRNRAVTMFSWFLSYLFFTKGSRLITAAPEPRPPRRVSIDAMTDARPPLVGIIMGSQSDWETMQHAARALDELGVPSERRVVSAHRTPDQLFDYASTAADRGILVIIAGAGGAAHLPGMCASKTHLPVLGVPVESRALRGLDSLLSIVQMPGGVPVGTLAVGAAGALNAGLLAASIVALSDEALRRRLIEWRTRQTDRVLANPNPAAAPSGSGA